MERVGLQLVAEGADAYLRDLQQGGKAEEQIAAGAKAAAPLIDGVGDAAKGAGKGVDGFGDDAEKSSKQLSLLERIATGAAEKIGHLLVDGFAQAGQAVLQFATDGVKKAGDFEAGMNRFAAVTGDALDDSGKSLADFQKLFIQMGRDLPVSTADVQQAAIEMAKGGIEPATIAAGGLKTALDLAAAGEVGIAESAEILSKQLGVWVDQAADATTKSQFLAEAADLMSQAANASTVDVDDLALGLANTGKSADLAGLSFRQTVTSMALISSGFSSAADAGTSFKTFLARLQPTTDSQAEAFKRLNLLTSEGTSKFYDATGSFIGMDKAAELLKQSLSGMSDAQKEAALNAAFGSDAIRTAGMLADAGADGYQRMAAEMAKVGSVAAQAAKKQQGFNVAMDNLMGSLEALQLTIATGGLPMLTSLVNLLSKGINVVTDYADATMKGETALAQIADVVHDAFLPALAAAGAALIAYAYSQIPAVLTALPGLITMVGTATGAFIANAVAVAAAAAPFVLVAAAIGGVVYAFQDFTGKVSDATTALLNSRPFWTDSTAAIEDYATQTGRAKDALAPYAKSIEVMRDQIQGEIDDLGKRSAAGLVSDEQMQAELATINRHREGLIVATAAYNDQEQAILKQTTASMTATAEAGRLTDATAEIGDAASLTAKDVEDLGKQIEDTYAKGQDAVSKYAQSQSEFLSGVEARQKDHAEKIADLEAQKAKATTDEQRKGFDDQIKQVNQAYKDQEAAAADSYARQQAAQTQHLGQMLIDYTVAQAQLGNIQKDKAAEITAALEKEYGLQESSVASTFLHMAGSIDDFASSAGKSTNSLIDDLRAQQREAGETQKKLDDAFHDRTYEITSNFIEAKGDAEDFAHALETIPKEIHTTVVTDYVERGKQRQGGQVDDTGEGPHRASGGPVEAMHAYTVGEHGTETFVPAVDGTIVPHGETKAAILSLMGMASPAASSRVTNIYVDARGSSLTMADVQHAVQAGLRAEGDMADIRIRAGVA